MSVQKLYLSCGTRFLKRSSTLSFQQMTARPSRESDRKIPCLDLNEPRQSIDHKSRATPNHPVTVPSNSRISTPLAIIIMGVSGTGKSTVGAALASVIGAPFLEGDSFHTPEAIAKMRAGVPLTDQDRWPWLDRISNSVEASVLDHGRTVTACSALRRAYRDRLRARITAPVRFALLTARREALLCRLSERPNHYMPSSLLSSQLDTLELPQPDEQAITLDAELSSAALCAKIIAWLESDLPG